MAIGQGCPEGKFGWQCRYDCFCDGPCDNVTGHCENCTGTRWGPGCLLNSSCMYHDNRGIQYQGKLSVGNDVCRCIPWYPKIHNYGPERFSDGNLTKASNYCRNPRGDGNQYASGPWCYHIRPPPTNWSHCVVSHCECPQGRFGLNCLSECHCSDHENTCVSDSGECRIGRCHAHFNGTSCQECVDGRFSVNCDKVCHCKDRSEVCNKNTGHCASGCTAGWLEPDCQTACINGTFGKNCVNRCRCFNPREVCEKANGTCTKSGCAAGWHGPGCQTECVQGRYGPNCGCNCSDSCQEPGSCNRTSGFCICQAGYKPPTCHHACMDGSFGFDCIRRCRCLNETEVCEKTNGTCTHSGCAAGWFGPGCQTECLQGEYGPNCAHTCSAGCEEPRKCNKVSGTCRCQAGYQPPTCHIECMDGSFGNNCLRECRCFNESEVCDKINGTCRTTGCRAGWHGLGCQTECAQGHYGRNCAAQCSEHCTEPGNCDKVLGACVCKAGYLPPTCHKRCEAGRYGQNCKYTCSSGCNNTCDRLNGVCSCLPGYKGSTCSQMCNDGKFGHNCSYSCNCHNRMEVCVKATGICEMSGCKPGWHGQGCQTAFTYYCGTSVAWGVAGLFAVLFITSLIAEVIVLWKCMIRKTEHQETKPGDVTKNPDVYHNIEDIALADDQNTKYESVRPTATSNQGITPYEHLRFDWESGGRKYDPHRTDE